MLAAIAVSQRELGGDESVVRNLAGEVEEVSGLPDSLPRLGSSSETVDRVRRKQQEKQERALQEFRDKLSELSSQHERRIAEASSSLKEHMDGITAEMEQLFSPLSNRDTLLSSSYSQIEDVWSQTLTLSGLQQSSIDRFSDNLSEMEKKKSSSLNGIFVRYSAQFTRMGYLTPPQCVALLENEAWKMNQTLLDNQRSCVQLLFRLRTSYLGQEKRYHDRWLSVLDLWKQLKVDAAAEQFGSFISGDEIQNPPEFSRLLEELSKEQEIINRERKNLIYSITTLCPPSVTASSVEEWEKMAKGIHNSLEALNSRYLVMLNDALSRVHEYSLSEAMSIKNILLTEKVCDEEEVLEVMNERLLPPVEEREDFNEEVVHSVEESLDTILSQQRSQLEDIADAIGDAQVLWEQHQDGLRAKERRIQEQLDNTRAEHNVKNQQLESSLDLWLDRLRQAPNKSELHYQSNLAKKYLRNISEGYTEFEQGMREIVDGYPQQISSQLILYEDSLLKGLSVTKMPPHKSIQRRRSVDSFMAGGRVTRASGHGGGLSKPAFFKTEPLRTEKGSTYYWAIPPETVQLEDTECFITQASSKHNLYIELATSNVNLPDHLVFLFKKSLILGYLNHLEVWKKEGVERARAVVSSKGEELNSELELRFHLHEPRENNINQDIREVREREMMEHERVFEELSLSGETSLENQRYALNMETTTNVDNMTAEFRESLKSLESHLSKLDKQAQLQGIIDVAESTKLAHLKSLKTLIKRFRVSLDDTLFAVKQSNAVYRANLKTFSEGGNFAPEEIEHFSRKLDSLTKNIDIFETTVKAELDTLQSHHYQSALDSFAKVCDRFEHSHKDINFMDRINAKFNEIQLQIKIETAASNSQAEDIQHHVHLLDQIVESLPKKFEEMQMPDYELIKCAIQELYKKTQARIDYLFCSPSQLEQIPLIKFQKVSTDVISAMGVTRSILRPPSKVDRRKSPFGQDSLTPQAFDNDRPKSSAKLTPSYFNGRRSCTPSLSGKNLGGRKGVSRYLLLKNPNFGMEGGNDTANTTSLLPKIRKILYSKNDELFQMSDHFYRSRSNRTSLHIESLPETSEMCMLNVNKRLHSYQSQVEEYREACIQELRAQMERLHAILARLPLAVFSGVLYQVTFSLQSEKKNIVDIYSRKLTEFERVKESNRSQLRPNLGHMTNKQILDKLCQTENERHESAGESFAKCNNLKKKQLIQCGDSFTSQLEDQVNLIKDLFRSVIYPTDIIKIQKQTNPHTPVSTPEIETPEKALPCLYIQIPKAWYNMQAEELEQLDLTTSQSNPEGSELHLALFESRDSVFQAMLKDFIFEFKDIEEEYEKRLKRENAAFELWNKSVSEIIALFT